MTLEPTSQLVLANIYLAPTACTILNEYLTSAVRSLAQRVPCIRNTEEERHRGGEDGEVQGRGERVGTFSVPKGQVLCAPSVGVDGGTRRDTDDPASAWNSRHNGEQMSKSSPSPTLARPGGRKDQGCCHMEGRGDLAEPVRGINGRQAGTKALG